MNSDLVSVIVPVYNSKNNIEKCFDSLMRQTYPTIEIIMVDDGSLDDSGELLDSFQEKYPIVIIHKPNGGAGSARNAGLDIAMGEWIVFVDSDDTYVETAIAQLVEMCKRSHCLLGCCGTQTEESELSDMQRKVDQTQIHVYDQESGMQKLLEEQILSYLHCKIYHKSLFLNLRIPEKMTFEDLYIMPEIFAEANRIVETKEKLYFYNQDREGNISSSKNVRHSLDLSIAQRHRYEIANHMTGLPASTKELLLYRAVRSSLGAYRRCALKSSFQCERKEVIKFIKRNRQEIMRCRYLTFPYKCLAVFFH